MRLDHLQRPELNKGTIDFTVPEEYWASHPAPRLSVPYHTVDQPFSGSRRPQPMNYVFAFDVSNEAVQSGFLNSACAAVGKMLYGGMCKNGLSIQPCFPRGSQIAILSFDRALHFYDLSVCAESTGNMTTTDLVV
jgi:protein transport protein SEC24